MGDQVEIDGADIKDKVPGTEINLPTTESFFQPPCYDKLREIIRAVQDEVLTGKAYSPDEAEEWSTTIGNEVNKRCRELRIRRYKHIVHVLLVELKGAGVKAAIKSVWDQETDGFTSDKFINETIMLRGKPLLTEHLNIQRCEALMLIMDFSTKE